MRSVFLLLDVCWIVMIMVVMMMMIGDVFVAHLPVLRPIGIYIIVTNRAVLQRVFQSWLVWIRGIDWHVGLS